MANKKAKEMKNLVEAVLVKQDKDYDSWLYQKHLEFLAENSDTVLSALKNKGE